MAEQDKIQARIVVAFPGGVTVDETKLIQEISTPPIAYGYDRIDVVIPKATAPDKPGTISVDIQPANKQHLLFLLIQADKPSAEVSYRVGDDANAITLDWVQMFCGAGMLALLPKDPKTLHFSNGNAETTVKVTVLVGRKAESPAAP